MAGDLHWRKPDPGDAHAWIEELRQRTHDLRTMQAAVEKLAERLMEQVRELRDTDRLEAEITNRLRKRRVLELNWTAKLLGIGLVAMQLVTIVKGFL